MALLPNNKWVIRREGQANDYWSVPLNGWAAFDEATLFDSSYIPNPAGDASLPRDGYFTRTYRKRDER